MKTKPIKKTEEEIDKLKSSWAEDPCWDIEETEGFERHFYELLAFRQEKERIWDMRYAERKRIVDEKADELGTRGLYRLILGLQEQVEKLEEVLNNEF